MDFLFELFKEVPSRRNIGLLIKPIAENGIVTNKDKRLGFGAVYQNQSYDLSGSFHYVSLVSGEVPSDDFRFQDTFRRIDTGTARFEHAENYSDFAASWFNDIVERLKKSNMHGMVVFPPFANAVYKKMAESKKYSYTDALTKKLDKVQPFFDFTNPNAVSGTTNCEFIDGMHGGEMVYARMILQMAYRDKSLANVVNVRYLTDLINNHSGLSSPETINLYGNGKAEPDFLGLGCAK